MAFVAGSLLLKLGGDDSQLAAVLKRSADRLKAFGNGIQSLGGKIGGVGKQWSKYAAGMAAPLAGAVMEFNRAGDAFDKMSGRTGVAVQSLSELAYAADMSGTSIADIETSVTSMSSVLTRQTARSKKMVEAIGLSFEELAGLSPEDSFLKIAAALHDTEDATLKAAAAQALFGGSGVKLLPMLGDIQSLREEAKRLGVTMSGPAAKSAAMMNDALARVTFTVKSLLWSVGEALAPTITDMANRVASTISTVRAWIAQNQALILSIAKGVAVFGALSAALVGVGSVLTLVGGAVAGLGSLLATLAAVAGAVLSPVGLLVAGIAGGAYAFLTMTDAGLQLVDFFADQFQQLYGYVKPVLDAIVSAFKMGDLAGAASIAFQGVKVAALSLWSYLRPLWDNGVYYLASLWDSIAYTALEAWTVLKSGLTWDFLYVGLLSILKFVQSAFLTGIAAIADGFAWLIKKAIGALESLGVISRETERRAKQAVSALPQGVKDLRDANNQFYDDEINATYRDMANTEGGRELAALDDARAKKQQERAQALADSEAESAKALADAKNELAELVRQQAEQAANPVELAPVESPLRKAASIDTRKVADTVKTSVEVGNTASFSGRVASMLAQNASTKIEEKQLQTLESIDAHIQELELGYA